MNNEIKCRLTNPYCKCGKKLVYYYPDGWMCPVCRLKRYDMDKGVWVLPNEKQETKNLDKWEN